MEKQQPEPYAGVAVPVNEAAPVAPVPYTGAEPVAPAQVVAQESLPYKAGVRVARNAHVQLADGRILEVAVPPGTPPGHQIHFPVAAARTHSAGARAPAAYGARAGAPSTTARVSQPVSRPPSVSARSVTVNGCLAWARAVCRIGLTDGRHLDITVPAGGATAHAVDDTSSRRGNVGARAASCSRDGHDPDAPGAIPGSVFRIKLTDGRDPATVPILVVPPVAPLAPALRPVDRHATGVSIKKKTHPLACVWSHCTAWGPWRM